MKKCVDTNNSEMFSAIQVLLSLVWGMLQFFPQSHSKIILEIKYSKSWKQSLIKFCVQICFLKDGENKSTWKL